MAQEHASKQPTGSSNYIKNVAIVGATGTSGKYIVEALLANGKQNITAITREGSTAQFPAGITVKKINYDDHSSIVSALQGQEALIITMGVRAPPEQQTKLIHAAADAGVSWILPNEYGYDSANESLRNDIHIGTPKSHYTDLIESLGKSSWIGFTCGFWYEFSLGGGPERFGFDFKARTLTLFDAGTQPITTTTFPQVGRGVAALLNLPIHRDDENETSTSPSLSDYKNRFCYIGSFILTQLDMLSSVLRVTSTSRSDWKITHEDSQTRYQNGKKMLQEGDFRGMVVFMYTRNFFPDGVGNHAETRGLDNEKLGLPKEDLDEYTQEAIRMKEEGGLGNY
ncbi:MAG: hypothetical protein L6R40_006006 [Gallowayella cf. fulva]|nr:MAG: hypothetical protein L6R40_006006 [Xanthomendoza cf. fulva]